MLVQIKKKKLLFMIMSVILLTGCKQQVEEVEIETENSSSQLLTYVTTDESVINTTSSIAFEPGETIPLILEGHVKGYLTINWVQRLGIWDYDNTTAVTVGVKSSYTININVDMSESINSAESVVLTVKPYLITTSGEVVGSPCCVGWSGFSQTAQLYDNTTAMNIEVGVQPEVLDEADDQLLLKITDSAGNAYDNIILSNNYLTTAEQGPSLITADSVNVTAINGASFTISVSDVTTEEHTIEDEINASQYYDYSYTIAYNSLPTNDREDLLFDSNNNNNLHTKLVNYVTSDVDLTKLYDNVPNALRLIYADKMDTETYVTTDFSDIAVGNVFSASCNRAIPITTGNPTYVRICFEFPEETEARTLEEMKSFNGRFIVFQRKIGERVLDNFYSGVD